MIEESRIEQGIEEMCAAPDEEKQTIIRGWQEIRQLANEQER